MEVEDEDASCTRTGTRCPCLCAYLVNDDDNEEGEGNRNMNAKKHMNVKLNLNANTNAGTGTVCCDQGSSKYTCSGNQTIMHKDEHEIENENGAPLHAHVANITALKNKKRALEELHEACNKSDGANANANANADVDSDTNIEKNKMYANQDLSFLSASTITCIDSETITMTEIETEISPLKQRYENIHMDITSDTQPCTEIDIDIDADGEEKISFIQYGLNNKDHDHEHEHDPTEQIEINLSTSTSEKNEQYAFEATSTCTLLHIPDADASESQSESSSNCFNDNEEKHATTNHGGIGLDMDANEFEDSKDGMVYELASQILDESDEHEHADSTNADHSQVLSLNQAIGDTRSFQEGQGDAAKYTYMNMNMNIAEECTSFEVDQTQSCVELVYSEDRHKTITIDRLQAIIDEKESTLLALSSHREYLVNEIEGLTFKVARLESDGDELCKVNAKLVHETNDQKELIRRVEQSYLDFVKEKEKSGDFWLLQTQTSVDPKESVLECASVETDKHLVSSQIEVFSKLVQQVTEQNERFDLTERSHSTTMKEKAEELESHLASLDEKDHALKSLLAEKDVLIAEVNALKQKEEGLEFEVARSKAEADALRNTNCDLLQHNSEHEEQLYEAQRKLADNTKDKTKIIDNLQNTINEKQGAMKCLSKKKDELDAQMERLVQKQMQLEIDIATSKADAGSLRETNIELLQQNTVQEEKLRLVETSHEHITKVKIDTIERLRRIMDEKEIALKSLSDEKDNLNAQINLLVQNERQLERQITVSNADTDALHKVHSEVVQRVAEQNEQLDQAERSHAAVVKEKTEELESHIASLGEKEHAIKCISNEKVVLMEQLTQLNCTVNNLNTEIESLRRSNTDLSKLNIDEVNQRLEAELNFNTTVREKEDIITNLNLEISSKHNVIIDLRKQMDDISMKMKSLEDDKNQRELDIISFQNEIFILRDINSDLLQQYSHQENKYIEMEQAYEDSVDRKEKSIIELQCEMKEDKAIIKRLSTELAALLVMKKEKESESTAYKDNIHIMTTRLKVLETKSNSTEKYHKTIIGDLEKEIIRAKEQLVYQKTISDTVLLKSEESYQMTFDKLQESHSKSRGENVLLIENLEKSIATKQDSIQALTADILEKEKLGDCLSDKLKEGFEKEREGLNIEIENCRRTIDTLSASLTEKEFRMNEMDDIITEKEHQINSLHSNHAFALARVKDLERRIINHIALLNEKDNIISQLREEIKILESIKCAITEQERSATACLIMESYQDGITIATAHDNQSIREGLRKTLTNIRTRLSRHLEEAECSATHGDLSSDQEDDINVKMMLLESVSEKSRLAKYFERIISEKQMSLDNLSRDHGTAMEREIDLSAEVRDLNSQLEAKFLEVEDISRKLTKEGNTLIAAKDKIATYEASILAKEAEIKLLRKRSETMSNSISRIEEEKQRLVDAHEKNIDLMQIDIENTISKYTSRISELEASRKVEKDEISRKSVEARLLYQNSEEQIATLQKASKKIKSWSRLCSSLCSFLIISTIFLLFELYGATEKGSAGMNINNHLTASNSDRSTLDCTLHTNKLEYTGGHEVLSFAIKALATALLIGKTDPQRRDCPADMTIPFPVLQLKQTINTCKEQIKYQDEDITKLGTQLKKEQLGHQELYHELERKHMEESTRLQSCLEATSQDLEELQYFQKSQQAKYVELEASQKSKISQLETRVKESLLECTELRNFMNLQQDESAELNAALNLQILESETNLYNAQIKYRDERVELQNKIEELKNGECNAPNFAETRIVPEIARNIVSTQIVMQHNNDFTTGLQQKIVKGKTFIKTIFLKILSESTLFRHYESDPDEGMSTANTQMPYHYSYFDEHMSQRTQEETSQNVPTGTGPSYHSSQISPEIVRQTQIMKSYRTPGYNLVSLAERKALMKPSLALSA